MTDLNIVLAVAVISWLGIFLYLLRLDLRLRKVERNHES